jgi:hypothetical protein
MSETRVNLLSHNIIMVTYGICGRFFGSDPASPGEFLFNTSQIVSNNHEKAQVVKG